MTKEQSLKNLYKTIRKSIPPAGKTHGSKKGKRGYNRRHDKKNWERVSAN